ncbi:MAG: glycoside hydrolase family 15 protein [Gemmatimonadetes bacterium]|nr:glycoside hydrolase family 15 protein [Gemmatimonadota bacterium]
MSYPAIADHGVIGDLHTAALVGRDGSIDWACLPRFDSMSLFAAILDDAKGGRWRVAPRAYSAAEQRYLAGTNVLQTVFRTEGGVADLTDFMPVGPSRAGRSRIFRRVRAVRGQTPIQVSWEPRFDYATRAPTFHPRRHGVLATDLDNDVAAIIGPAGVAWRLADGAATAGLTLAEGEAAWFVGTFDEDELGGIPSHDPEATLDATVRFWDAWSSRLRYDGPFRREVERSALALKLCCYEPTGAIVAAPTTSLPESLAGGRNWDYRYTWLRDSAFVLYALDRLGYETETDAFLGFLKRVCRREDSRSLQIMFAVDGERQLPERTLDHLEGYRGTGPVLVGNGAVDQFQLDVYGEVLDTAHAWTRRRAPTEGLWKVVRDLADWTAAHWREPDSSIWEPRLGRRHYVFSKVMAWVALHRGAQIAEAHGHAADAERWRRDAAEIHADVLARGWDAERRTFVQAYGESSLDAALLAIPTVHFLPYGDRRVRGTLDAVRRELATSCEELLYRFRARDGLEGGEGAFVFGSLWMMQNLAMVGEHAEGERLFRNLLRRGGELGLLAEEIDPATGEQLGNYPQALSHAGVINTAFILEKLRGGG